MSKIKEVLKECNITYEEISKTLNIKSHSTISLKINGKSNFTTKEASLLKELVEEKSGKKYSIEELFEEE